jgi:hypothetical protein
MSRALLKEGLKKPKEKAVRNKKPYSAKASAKKAVETLKKMSETPGSLPI